MTELSQKILDTYQIRKTSKQKTAFIELLRQYIPSLIVESEGMIKTRNLVVGDVEKAEVILCAHYDTCAWMPVPNFIMPRNMIATLGYSLILIVPILLAVLLLNWLLGLVTADFWFHYWVSLICVIGFLYLMIAGPANRHTANDNTSGVVTLCEIYSQLSQEEREQVAFVFFDLEEAGLIGSARFRKKYKKQMRNKLLINFDCVSEGDHILLSVSKAAMGRYEKVIRAAFKDQDDKYFLIFPARKVYYPSDQANFDTTIAVAALKHRKGLGYYMNRIHTHRDTVFDKSNIDLLRRQIVDLIRRIPDNKPGLQ